MATTLESDREATDAEFIEAINRSDSLELVPWDEVRGMFPEPGQPVADDARWTLAKGGQL